MKIALKGVLTGTDNPLRFSFEEDMSALVYYGQRPFPEPVRVSGAVEKHSEMITLDIAVSAVMHVPCASCGEPAVLPLEAESHFMLARTLQDEENDDILIYSDDELDLGPVVTDAVVLNIDSRPLCPACAGESPE